MPPESVPATPGPAPAAAADPHDLMRFLRAQEPVYAQVLAELAAARKTSHWMWFVFPQLRGLGRSQTARRYGIASAAEARAYAADPLLGARLAQCSALVLQARHRSVEEIFGAVDAVKLRSSMTLFERAAADGALYARVLDERCGCQRCAATLALLAAPA